MAREIRVRQRGEAADVRGDGLGRGEVQPTSVAEARRAIESTRGRISETLDAIEDRIQEKRHDLRNRLDVLQPVRHRIRSSVWPSLGIAFGGGLLLGLLRGGEREEDHGMRRHRTGMLSAAERRELRRWRAERRDRLAERTRTARRRGAGRRSMFAQVRSALGNAIIDGLSDRARRMGR